MKEPEVALIYIAWEPGKEMRLEPQVFAETGKGLAGDRYYKGKGNWEKMNPGNRQVTLIEFEAFHDAKGVLGMFRPVDSRRNIVTQGVRLNDLVGKQFAIGGRVRMRGVALCPPCDRVDQLCRKNGFKKLFEGKGGIIAEVLTDGIITTGSRILI